MNTNIETALMSLIGSDPRFQRAMAMMQGKTPAERQQIVMNMISTQGIPQTQLMAANILNGQTAQTADLVQRLRPAPVPAFVVPNPLAPTGTTTPTT